MARFRRRRRRFFWLPNLGIAGSTSGLAQDEKMSWDFLTVTIPGNGTVNTSITDVTFDDPSDTSAAGTTANRPMADFLRSGYMLRRVVGHLFVNFEPITAVELIQAVACTFGLFVARADETNDNQIPIGAGNQSEINQNYGPQNNDNVREPYLFRRSWIIGNPLATAVGPSRYPPTSADYPSGLDGSFVDQKTLRRVDGDNRLWAVFSARTFPIGLAHSGNAQMRATFDFRYLGRPISYSKKGSF